MQWGIGAACCRRCCSPDACAADLDGISAVFVEVRNAACLVVISIRRQHVRIRRVRRRLRLIAKQCVNYGQRVQNCVFECVLDAAQLPRAAGQAACDSERAA